jgi:PEGA domain
MNRTQLITLLLVLFAGIGVATAKPKVAVLGLEVLDKANAMTSIDAARQVTEGMRLAARASGPYEVADNSQREFVDEKVINQCTSEARDCLLKMAGNFGATALVYGRLQLSDNKKTFLITVNLLTADKNAAKPAVSAPVTASAQDLQSLGKKIYNELVGVTNLGSISIKTKASKGIVYLNGDMRGELVDGEHKSTQLAEGEYVVRISADGFKKWEETVRVKSGQTTVLEPALEAAQVAKVDEPEDKGSRVIPETKLTMRENTVSRGGSRRGWRIAAIGGAAVAAGSMALWTLQLLDREDSIDKLKGKQNGASAYIENIAGPPFAGYDCPDSGVTFKGTRTPEQEADAQETWRSACKNVRNLWILGTVAGVAGAFAALAIYQGYIRDEPESSSQALRKARKPRFAVTPIVSPQGGGATVRIDF